MGQVIKLDFPFHYSSREARIAAMVQCFAEERRKSSDVFWLKENAELLNVLESSGLALRASTFSPLEPFYASVDRKLGFFPQYYRFFLSICLDLEDLGLTGSTAARAVDWVAHQGLAAAELSDLQRAEARRLCLRRGVDPVKSDTGLNDRLRAFGARNDTFMLPNKKAAYELTHIVFYLSEYGRTDPNVPDAFIDSLKYAGTLAFLELNIDLLSEICIALRFAGIAPPEIWESWLREQIKRFTFSSDRVAWDSDDYHPFLMSNWFSLLAGTGGFGKAVPETGFAFVAPRASATPLRELSETMFKMDTARCSDWQVMRRQLQDSLSDETRSAIAAAEAAVDFDRFFAGFARTETPASMMRKALA